jgi:hypothetical protein
MFRTALSPKNRALLNNSIGCSNIQSLPTSWAEFAKLTEIRSGDGIVKFNPYQHQTSLVDTPLLVDD